MSTISFLTKTSIFHLQARVYFNGRNNSFELLNVEIFWVEKNPINLAVLSINT